MTFQEELIQLLKAEVQMLKDLLKLSLEKTDVIANNDVNSLTNITRKEEILVEKVVDLENDRVKVLDSWGIPIDTPISDVIKKLSENENTEQLEKHKEELQTVMDDLRVRNEENAKLLQSNLDWVDFNINLIASAETPTPYGQGNEKNEGNKIFDRKV